MKAKVVLIFLMVLGVTFASNESDFVATSCCSIIQCCSNCHINSLIPFIKPCLDPDISIIPVFSKMITYENAYKDILTQPPNILI